MAAGRRHGEVTRLKLTSIGHICINLRLDSQQLEIWTTASALLVSAAVGKSSLQSRFTEDSFSQTPIPNVGVDFKTRTIDIDGEQVKLSIWDTPGDERFPALVKCIRGWIRTIEQHAAENVCKILVGNKADMEEKRVVTKEQGQALADEFNINFFETSAKDGINVEEAFVAIARESKKLAALPPDERPNATVDRTKAGTAQKPTSCCIA